MKNDTYYWRPIPDYQICFSDAFPKAPVVLNTSDIVVKSLVFTDNILELTVVWDPPSIVYGTVIEKYEVRIGRNSLAPLEENELKQYAFVTFLNEVREGCDICTPECLIPNICLWMFHRTILLLAQMKFTKSIRSLVCICR